MNTWQKTWWDELRQRSVVSLMEISASIWNLQKHMEQRTLIQRLSPGHICSIMQFLFEFLPLTIPEVFFVHFVAICHHVCAYISPCKACEQCNMNELRGSSFSDHVSAATDLISPHYPFCHLVRAVGLNKEQFTFTTDLVHLPLHKFKNHHAMERQCRKMFLAIISLTIIDFSLSPVKLVALPSLQGWCAPQHAQQTLFCVVTGPVRACQNSFHVQGEFSTLQKPQHQRNRSTSLLDLAMHPASGYRQSLHKTFLSVSKQFKTIYGGGLEKRFSNLCISGPLG